MSHALIIGPEKQRKRAHPFFPVRRMYTRPLVKVAQDAGSYCKTFGYLLQIVFFFSSDYDSFGHLFV